MEELQLWLKYVQIRREFHMNAYVRFIVADDIISPSKRSIRVKWYTAVTRAEEIQKLCERATMLRYTYIIISCYSLCMFNICIY
jgi:hypothetical protein